MKAQLSLVESYHECLQFLANYTWQGIGLLLFYLITIAFVVYFFSEIYADKYDISTKTKWFVIAIGMMFGLLDMYFGESMIHFPIWGILALFLYIDWKYQDLPDAMNAVIAVLSIPVVAHSFFNASSYLDWTLLTSVTLFIFFLIIAILGPLGGGDIKMMAAIGLYFPLYEAPQLIFFGITVGFIHAIGLLVFTKAGMKSKFAFGPGLIVGVLLASIF